MLAQNVVNLLFFSHLGLLCHMPAKYNTWPAEATVRVFSVTSNFVLSRSECQGRALAWSYSSTSSVQVSHQRFLKFIWWFFCLSCECHLLGQYYASCTSANLEGAMKAHSELIKPTLVCKTCSVDTAKWALDHRPWSIWAVPLECHSWWSKAHLAVPTEWISSETRFDFTFHYRLLWQQPV